MKQLSIGIDSTLGNYRKLCVDVFGADSPTVRFIDDKIATSPNADKEEVIADEIQMIYMLSALHFGTKGENNEKTS